jgi:hypothetical protein
VQEVEILGVHDWGPRYSFQSGNLVAAYHECRALEASDAATCREAKTSATCAALPQCSWTNMYEQLLENGWTYATCEREADGRPNKLCTALCDNQFFCGGMGLDPYEECRTDYLRSGSSAIRKCEGTRPSSLTIQSTRACRYIATSSQSVRCTYVTRPAVSRSVLHLLLLKLCMARFVARVTAKQTQLVRITTATSARTGAQLQFSGA